MTFTETLLRGAYIIDEERKYDERGYFTRVFCQREFAAYGLDPTVVQMSIAFNRLKGTVRGLHFQFPPSAEAKLVRCTRGALLDVMVDLRPESPTYLQHMSVELTADNGRALYIPERFAHGYQTLADYTNAIYQMNEFWAPGESGGLAYDDPRLAVQWPLAVTEISQRDREWDRLDVSEHELRRRMASPSLAAGRANRS
jgi:dTDP-4-dehydrorhamnose 3,5-epimerase